MWNWFYLYYKVQASIARKNLTTPLWYGLFSYSSAASHNASCLNNSFRERTASPLFSINMWSSGNYLDGLLPDHFLPSCGPLSSCWGRWYRWRSQVLIWKLPFHPWRPNLSIPGTEVWKLHRGKWMLLNSPSLACRSGVPCQRKRSNFCTSNRECCWGLCQPRLPKGSTHKAGAGGRMRDRFLKNQRLLDSIFFSSS